VGSNPVFPIAKSGGTMGYFTPNLGYLSDMASFQGFLIGVAVPISLQVVSWIADRYKDQEIAKLFIREPLYKLQFFLILPHIAFCILLRFLNFAILPLLIFMFIWFIINLVTFYLFVKRVALYVTDADQILLQKLEKYVTELFEA
jgi:hypothetical protein